jgi:hypothetical protein
MASGKPIYCVAAMSRIVQRTIFTPPLSRHHRALDVELLCSAIRVHDLTFCEIDKSDGLAKSQICCVLLADSRQLDIRP